MMTSPLHTVLFDLDGTLLDTAPDLALALNQLCARHEKPSLPLEAIRPFASGGTRALLKLGFGITEQHPDFQHLRLAFLKSYDECLTKNTRLFDGIAELLTQIENKGLSWGIVTNKPSLLARNLVAHFDCLKNSQCIIGSDHVVAPKPAADSLLHACALLGKTPGQCLYVGDHQRDIQAAKAANMRSVAVSYGYLEPGEDSAHWGANYHATTTKDVWTAIINTLV